MENDPKKKRPHISEAKDPETDQSDPEEMVPGVEYRAGAQEEDDESTPTITLVTSPERPDFIED